MYSVILSAHGNPDRRQDPHSEIAPTKVAIAGSIEVLQEKVRKYIDEYCVGGGNWTGGKVFLRGEEIGYISYNGRWWPNEKGKLNINKRRDYAYSIVELFEELLERHDIYIPDEAREGNEEEACLYAYTYYNLVDEVEELLEKYEMEINNEP